MAFFCLTTRISFLIVFFITSLGLHAQAQETRYRPGPELEAQVNTWLDEIQGRAGVPFIDREGAYRVLYFAGINGGELRLNPNEHPQLGRDKVATVIEFYKNWLEDEMHPRVRNYRVAKDFELDVREAAKPNADQVALPIEEDDSVAIVAGLSSSLLEKTIETLVNQAEHQQEWHAIVVEELEKQTQLLLEENPYYKNSRRAQFWGSSLGATLWVSSLIALGPQMSYEILAWGAGTAALTWLAIITRNPLTRSQMIGRVKDSLRNQRNQSQVLMEINELLKTNYWQLQCRQLFQ